MTYRLKNLRLVNFHNFEDETLAIDGALFLIGDNESGKTTLLDGIHFALSAGLDMEFNAAARLGPRAQLKEGRSLQSIFLRVDRERGVRRPEGAVGYAALEVVDDAGRVLSFGSGAFVASLETRPDVWGFVTHRPLAEVPLVVPAGDGGSGKRAADKAELESALGRGAVMDVGRYRSQVGTRLFGDRERYEQVASFLAAGKSYRELVSRSRSFGAVFAELLPPPDAQAFQEIHRALRNLEETRANLGALEHELKLLRDLVDLIGEVQASREAQARYAFIDARWGEDAAEARRADKARSAALAGGARQSAEEERDQAERAVKAAEAELAELRATGEARLVAEQELRLQDLAVVKEESERRVARALALEARAEREAASLAEARRAVLSLRERMAEAVALVGPVVAKHCQERTAVALDRTGAVLQGVDSFEDPLMDTRQAVLEDLTATADRLRTKKAALEGQERTLLAEQEALGARASELRAQGELEPIEGLHRVLLALHAEGLRAEPVYRLLDLAAGVEAPLAGRLEQVLGPEVLGAIFPLENAGLVRARILALAPGVPVVDVTALPEGAPLEEGSIAALLLPDGPAGERARAFVDLRVGEVHLGAADGPHLDDHGVLYQGRAHVRLLGGPARFLGARARERALAAEIERLECVASALGTRRAALVRAAEEIGEIVRRLEGARRAFERDFLPDQIPALAAAAGEQLERLTASEVERDEAREDCSRALRRRAALLATVQGLEDAIAAAGAAKLASRMAALESGLAGARADLGQASDAASRAGEREAQALREHEQAVSAAAAARALVREAREALVRFLDAEAARDVDDYVFRAKAGRQIKPENMQERRDAALRAESAAIERLKGKGGIEDPGLWNRYAFRYDAATNQLLDSTAKPVEDVARARDVEVATLREALRGRSDDLLERIVLEDLTTSLRREVTRLDQTLRGVNRLVGDLRFGRSRYRFEAPLLPEYRRLHELLLAGTILNPAAREELKGFFLSRLDELASDGDALPSVLDYRKWFDFRIKVIVGDEQGVELSPKIMGAGSTGEQAVPNYLLLLCLTKLLYDRVDAKVRLLLLDEGFYGVDAGRRDELLRFAARAGIQLVVASPDVDGVRDGIESSTTVLVEKSAEGDIFLTDLRYREPQPDLFQHETFDPSQAVIHVDTKGSGPSNGAAA